MRFYIVLLLSSLFAFPTQAQEVKKKVVIEGFVTSPGIFGGFCPRAYQTFAELGDIKSQEDYEIIMVHGNCYNCSGADFDTINDGMYHPAYAKGMNSIGADAFPQASLDRHEPIAVLYTKDFLPEYNSMTQREPAAGIEVTANYDASTRNLNVSANVKFVNSTQNYRLALAITEHKVHRVDDIEFSQWNFYSPFWPNGVNAGGSITDSIAAYGTEFWKRNPRVESVYIYHPHVARAILPSFGGDPNSLPANTEAGMSYEHTFATYNISADYRPEMMRAIVLLIDENGKINNANGAWVNGDPASIEDDHVHGNIVVYPNPAQNSLSVRHPNKISSFEIMNSLGKVVLSGHLNSSTINIESLQKGSYFIILNDEDRHRSYHKKFIK